ncbi:MAG: leucine-rich repeat protein [Dysgonamonadaceae bacterium]|jgi:hypothetical protein|nr:leucine-rich repeat protein [Dysgonamonadaceae bacterium]
METKHCVRLSLKAPKAKRKILFLLLLLLTGTTAGLAQSGNCGVGGEEDDSVTWVLMDGILTISGTGEMMNCYSGAAPWYSSMASITEVIIKDGVTNIGIHAFYGCDNLESVTIGNSVTTIGNYAFYGLKLLTSITIPEGVETIEFDAFRDCGLITIDLPESLTNIEFGAFSGNNNMITVTIPKNLEIINSGTFGGCKSLQSVVFAGNEVKSIGEYAFGECTELSSISLPESLESIGESAFGWCSGLLSIDIPENVTSIGEYAFTGCKNLVEINVSENNAEYASEKGIVFSKDKKTLVCYPAGIPDTNYVIPDDVTSIGVGAFSLCSNLKSVTIGNSVATIGDYAFESCYNLESVTIGSQVESIGGYAFTYCVGLTSVINQNSTPQVIGKWVDRGKGSTLEEFYVFRGVDYNNVTLYVPDGAKNAYEVAPVWEYFGKINEEHCGDNLWWDLSESGVLTITGTGDMYDFADRGKDASPWSSLNEEITSINLSSEMTGIGSFAFFECKNISSIDIPASVTNIGSNAFADCDELRSVTLHEGLEEIIWWAFSYTPISGIVIPKSVTSIGTRAFFLCRELTGIDVDEENEHYTSVDGVLFDKEKTTLIQYPVGNTNENYIIPDGVTTIEEESFVSHNLYSVTIPQSVTHIEGRVFEGFGNLVSVTNLNPTPQEIDEYTFMEFDYDIDLSTWVEVDLKKVTLYVPTGSVGAYKAADGWKEFNIVELSQTETPSVTPLTLHKDLEDAIICAGESHTFAIEAEGDNLSYEWYYGNERIKGANGNTYTITNAELRDYERYYAIVRSQLGSYRSSVYSKNVRLWVADQLPESLQFVDFPSTVFTGNTYRIKLAGYPDVTQYSWSYRVGATLVVAQDAVTPTTVAPDTNDGVTFSPATGGVGQNETLATFGALSAGRGMLTVTLEHPCGARQATQAIEVQYPTGVEQVAETAIRVFPNPTAGIIKVSGTKSNQIIRIVDITGSLKGNYPAQDGETTIDLAGYSKGTYLIQYNGKTVKAIRK